MTPVAPALRVLIARIAELSARLGEGVTIDPLAVIDRSADLDLAPPGLFSPNRACRLVPAMDGWIAVNLAREDDAELIAAWLETTVEGDPWATILAVAARTPRNDLLWRARLLGLPVASVRETAGKDMRPTVIALGRRKNQTGVARGLRVVDLSNLWAGPLCGDILARCGMAVVKVESRNRPDGGRETAFFERLNRNKSRVTLDFAEDDDRVRLRTLVCEADVVITGARPRAFRQLGLDPKIVFAANPHLVWVAITGYGWTGEGADRVSFGDDGAAAGGLLATAPDGTPRFLGDALADPLTGLAAAAGALEAVDQGGGVLVDAALARTAAGAARLIAGRKAA